MTDLQLGSRVWMNGQILAADQAFVPISDRGFTLGDGLFETMLWRGETVRFFDEHMTRLAASCVALGFIVPCSISEIRAGLADLGRDAGGGPAALRLTLTRGSGPRGLAVPDKPESCLIASIAPIKLVTSPIKLKTISITRNPEAPSTRFKTLSYIDNIMALQEARLAGANDGIMLSNTGYVACTSSANLILRHQGSNLTPALEDGALPGIVRGQLLQAGLIEEARITPTLLSTCDAIAQTNALIGVRCVAEINGRLLPALQGWAQSLIDTL